MICSPLRYPGGKSRAVEKIAGLIPVFEEFREPLVSGGSVFFIKNKSFRRGNFGKMTNTLNSQILGDK